MAKIRVHLLLEAATQRADGVTPDAVATMVQEAVMGALSGYEASARVTSAYVVPTEATVPEPDEDAPPVVEPGDPVDNDEGFMPA